MGVAFAGIAIKMFIKKGAVFTKSCSSADSSGKKMGCTCESDGSKPKCKNYEKHHGKQVNVETIKI